MGGFGISCWWKVYGIGILILFVNPLSVKDDIAIMKKKELYDY